MIVEYQVVNIYTVEMLLWVEKDRDVFRPVLTSFAKENVDGTFSDEAKAFENELNKLVQSVTHMERLDADDGSSPKLLKVWGPGVEMYLEEEESD